MAKAKKYDILSPDGFSIDPSKTYKGIKAAKAAFERWKERYKAQGYYSFRMQRIALADLEMYCTMVEL